MQHSSSAVAKRQYIFGKWYDDREIDLDLAVLICREAQARRARMAQFPMSHILRLFQAVGGKWSSPSYPPRQKMLELLPSYSGFSRDMIVLGLQELPFLFNADVLRQKIATEFQNIPRGADYHFDFKTQRLLRWHPLGTVFHVLSGNVFLVGPGSLIEGALTGNVSILKQSSSETMFMPVFLESLIETEKELGLEPVISESVALIDLASSKKEEIHYFKQHVDGLVIWGGEAAVQAYRHDVPASTRVIVFGPKLSLALLTARGMVSSSSEDCAKKLAGELSLWDQNACTAPQVCFVEGVERAHVFAEHLHQALACEAEKRPSGQIDLDHAAEIQKWRSIAQIKEARGLARLWQEDSQLGWTVICENELGDIEPSPLYRTIKIYPFQEVSDVLHKIKDLRSYVQTVGLVSSSEEMNQLSHDLGQCGVLRLMPLGAMSGEDIDDPHDGAYDLPQFMNLVVTKLSAAERMANPIEYMSPVLRRQVINDKFLDIVNHAARHPFYKTKLAGLKIDSIDDLEKLPITTKNEFLTSMSPTRDTTKWHGGFVTRSGGSTGKPSFSYFSKVEWDEMVRHAIAIFRSCGFNEQDRIANFLFAGDLYGSFISFNDVNHGLGMTSFPFAGNFDAGMVKHVYDTLGFNAVQGFPAVIMPLLKELHRGDPSFTIEKVMYAGQPMSEEDRRWLKEILGARIVVSVIGTTEAGQIGYQGPDDYGLVHTLMDEFNFIEILDAEGRPLPDGEVGEIAVTALFKPETPVLRYKLGDQGRILTTEQYQGDRNVRKLEYLGRADQNIVIGTMRVSYQDIVTALHIYKPSFVQLEVDTVRGHDRLKIHIESEDPLTITKDKLLGDLLEEIENLALAKTEVGLLIEIYLYQPGKLHRNASTGKIKSIIDHRFSS